MLPHLKADGHVGEGDVGCGRVADGIAYLVLEVPRDRRVALDEENHEQNKLQHYLEIKPAEARFISAKRHHSYECSLKEGEEENCRKLY